VCAIGLACEIQDWAEGWCREGREEFAAGCAIGARLAVRTLADETNVVT